jgi:hypothetical protein
MPLDPGYKTAMSLSRLAQLIHELVAKIGPVVPLLHSTMPPAQDKSLINLPLVASWRPGQSFRIDRLSKSAEDMVANEKEEKKMHARQQLADRYLEDTGKVMPVREVEEAMRGIETNRSDSCKEYEFVEESVQDEFLLVDQHIRELQYHDLRYMKNQVDAHYRLIFTHYITLLRGTARRLDLVCMPANGAEHFSSDCQHVCLMLCCAA